MLKHKNMANNNNSTSSSLGFGSILTLIFITLKLTNYINWSWFWVLLPSLLPLIIVMCLAIFSIIAYYNKNKKLKKEIEKLKDKN